MSKTFHLTIARLGENLFDGEAISVTLPGKEGVFQVLAGHEPLVAELSPGAIHTVAADEQTYHVEIPHGGVAEISSGEATILI